MKGEISLEMTFDAGHRIVGHKGKCARLHGHTYRVQIMCAGYITEPGFVVDFGDIKDLVNEWDHRMLLWEDDAIPLDFDQWGVIRLPFNPTAELMANYLAVEISTRLKIPYVEVILWETPNCSARATYGR